MNFPTLDLHDRKTQLAIGGVGAVGAFALYKRKSAGAAAASSGTSSGTISDPVASAAFGASSLENSIVGDLQPQIDNLAGQIAGLKPSSPAPTPPVAKPVPKPVAKPAAPVAAKLPAINRSHYAISVPSVGTASDPLVRLGVVGPGAWFTGYNVGGGAPVYAVIGNRAVQNFDPKKLLNGTQIMTYASLKAYIVPKTVKYQL